MLVCQLYLQKGSAAARLHLNEGQTHLGQVALRSLQRGGLAVEWSYGGHGWVPGVELGGNARVFLMENLGFHQLKTCKCCFFWIENLRFHVEKWWFPWDIHGEMGKKSKNVWYFGAEHVKFTANIRCEAKNRKMIIHRSFQFFLQCIFFCQTIPNMETVVLMLFKTIGWRLNVLIKIQKIPGRLRTYWRKQCSINNSVIHLSITAYYYLYII